LALDVLEKRVFIVADHAPEAEKLSSQTAAT
jgi:hypothetical protein